MASKSGTNSKDHLPDKSDDDRRKFNPFKKIRQIFRGGNKKHSENNKSTEDLAGGKLDRHVSKSHDSIFAADVRVTSLPVTYHSSPKSIPPNPLQSHADPTNQGGPPTHQGGPPNIQKELHFRFNNSLQIDQPDESILSTSAPAFLSSRKNFGHASNGDEEEAIVPHPMETSSSQMEQPSDVIESGLNNNAAYDKIAARPRNRKPRRKKPTFTEEATSNIFNTLNDAFPLSVPQLNQGTSVIQAEPNEDFSIESPDLKKTETSSKLFVEVKREVSVKKASSFKSMLGSGNESRDKGIAVKKSRSFKSLIGSGSILMPSLNEMQKVKLRKTISSTQETTPSDHGKADKCTDSFDVTSSMKRAKSPTQRPQSMLAQSKNIFSLRKVADQQPVFAKANAVTTSCKNDFSLPEVKSRKKSSLKSTEGKQSCKSASDKLTPTVPLITKTPSLDEESTGSVFNVSLKKAYSNEGLKTKISKREKDDSSSNLVDYRAMLGKRVLSEGDSPIKTRELPETRDFKAKLNVTSPSVETASEDATVTFQLKLRKVNQDDSGKRDVASTSHGSEVKKNISLKPLITTKEDFETATSDANFDHNRGKEKLSTKRLSAKRFSDQEENSSNADAEESSGNIFKQLRKVSRSSSDKKSKDKNVKPLKVNVETTMMASSGKGKEGKLLKNKDDSKVESATDNKQTADVEAHTFSAALRGSDQTLKKSEDVSEKVLKNVAKSNKSDPKPGFVQLRSTGLRITTSQNKNNNNSSNVDKEQKHVLHRYSDVLEYQVPKSPSNINNSNETPNDVQKKLESKLSVKEKDDYRSSNAEDDNRDDSDPSWVSLARKRSKKWTKSSTPAKPVDINIDEKKQMKDGSVKEDARSISSKQTEDNEQKVINNDFLLPQTIETNIKITEVKTPHKKPARRSTSHDPVAFSSDLSPPQTQDKKIIKKPLQHSSSSGAPSWMEIAMKKQKHWACEEPV